MTRPLVAFSGAARQALTRLTPPARASPRAPPEGASRHAVAQLRVNRLRARLDAGVAGGRDDTALDVRRFVYLTSLSFDLVKNA